MKLSLAVLAIFLAILAFQVKNLQLINCQRAFIESFLQLGDEEGLQRVCKELQDLGLHDCLSPINMQEAETAIKSLMKKECG